MLHKAWNSKEEMPYCFPRSSIKFKVTRDKTSPILTQIGRFGLQAGRSFQIPQICLVVELWWINISEFKSESEYLETIDCFIYQGGHSALDGWAAVRCMGKMSLHEIWIRCMRKVGLHEIWVVQSLECVLDSCIYIPSGLTSMAIYSLNWCTWRISFELD